MNRLGLRILVLSVVIALATWALQWWVVPIIGATFGFAATRLGRPFPVVTPLVAGLLGWGALVVVAGVQGGAGRVATMMGGVLGLPGWALYVVTPLYGALLAMAGALAASGLTGRRVAT